MTIKEIINALKKVKEKIGSDAKVFYFDEYLDEYTEIGYVGYDNTFNDIDIVKKFVVIM